MEEKLAFECSDLKYSTLFLFNALILFNPHSLTMLPLHSTVSSDEQMRVFVKLADKTQRKVTCTCIMSHVYHMFITCLSHVQVILATNIAESSLTVPDIRYGNIIFILIFKYFSPSSLL